MAPGQHPFCRESQGQWFHLEHSVALDTLLQLVGQEVAQSFQILPTPHATCRVEAQLGDDGDQLFAGIAGKKAQHAIFASVRCDLEERVSRG
jgi:hypothetical protein